MNYILFDGEERNALLPFTFTRPVAEIRIGILTFKEKWEKQLQQKVSYKTELYLSTKYSMVLEADNVFISASVAPDSALIEGIKNLKQGEVLVSGSKTIAYRSKNWKDAKELVSFTQLNFNKEFLSINNPWDIFSKNGIALEADFATVTAGRKSAVLSKTNTVLGNGAIFIEEGASVECCVLNTEKGSIYIGAHAKVMEGSFIRGGFSLGAYGILKMGTRIYGPTTAGPYCKLGGEVNNSVLFGYSSKGHDGYLGNSVLGEWCNIGADTNASNLKNNYAEVRIWNYNTENFAKTGLQFCGLLMGDHSKCGINTMFNTGTVIGVNSNIFGSGFPRNFIPSFSWGGAAGFSTYLPKKAYEVATVVMGRKDIEFDAQEQAILDHVF